jgi:hypothetical protein
MRTSQIGEWSGNLKEAAGLSKHTAPDTFVGATKSLGTGKRFFCPQCKTLQTVIAVQGIKQLPASAEYSVTLDCSHTRQVVTAVSRTPSSRAKLAEKEQAELREIRSAMESDQLL